MSKKMIIREKIGRVVMRVMWDAVLNHEDEAIQEMRWEEALEACGGMMVLKRADVLEALLEWKWQTVEDEAVLLKMELLEEAAKLGLVTSINGGEVWILQRQTMAVAKAAAKQHDDEVHRSNSIHCGWIADQWGEEAQAQAISDWEDEMMALDDPERTTTVLWVEVA